ncbi:XK-related protein 5a [Denticeps clupeoides]|uniref:XK-related protein n=1 Tax=Denticeps clupeoides TaxID=299321 RepID=A0AAY4BQX1_9TELE|nr:XK-related protein 5-like [Denticeps clupeoides]
MPSAARKGCWTARCQALLLAVSALLVVAERSALLFLVGCYLWVGETFWAAWTIALFVPGTLVQALSCRWYFADGDKRRCFLTIIHVLHLGLFKRFWDCMGAVWQTQGSVGELGTAVMQQADVAGLRLLEGLLLTLPQTLLQTYVLVATDVGVSPPVALCCGLCLLSLSWALVLFSRACCLIRPGHLAMPPAVLLCQLLWRVGMLGARVASLMFFARAFGWWVCGVVGFHWLTASFWLVSQQTDICTGPWSWRLFNGALGMVHIFFFLNVKDGRSRFRMAGFYVVMLLENATLMLAASDLLNEASWDSLTPPTAVFCSFLSGLTSLVLYYRFLHPKSTEISQMLHHGGRAHMGSTCLERAESSVSLEGKSLPAATSFHSHSHCSFSLSGVASSFLEHPGGCRGKADGRESSGGCRHHHWFLIRLALKTGDPGKINQAYGSGGVAAILEVEGYHSDLKAGGGMDEGSLEDKKAGMEENEALAPLSDCKEEFQSVSEEEPTSRDNDENDDYSLPMESPLESPVANFKRSSPEGKSVLGDSPEPNFCPTESSSTLYFSADPQSPSSGSNPRLDREHTAFAFGSDSLAELSPANSERGGAEVRGPLGRRYTSTPRLDSPQTGPTELSPGAGPRRNMMLSQRGHHDRFF